jgi:hypothetical protein
MISDWVGKLKKKRADPYVHFKEKKASCIYKKIPPKMNLDGTRRRERDSNPRRLAPQRFSRPPHSTALPSLRRKSTVTGYLSQKFVLK